MFNNLTDFSYQRNAKEACGFYVAYLIGLMILGAIFGGIMGIAVGVNNAAMAGVVSGMIVSILASIILPLKIIKAKSLNRINYLWAAAAVALAIIGLGMIFGLIPIAYLTTKPTNTTKTCSKCCAFGNNHAN